MLSAQSRDWQPMSFSSPGVAPISAEELWKMPRTEGYKYQSNLEADLWYKHKSYADDIL